MATAEKVTEVQESERYMLERKQRLIAYAQKILADKAEFVLVREETFTKQTKTGDRNYKRTFLERATPFVPSQSELMYVALRDRTRLAPDEMQKLKFMSFIELHVVAPRDLSRTLPNGETSVLFEISDTDVLLKRGQDYIEPGSALSAAEGYVAAIDAKTKSVKALQQFSLPERLSDADGLSDGQIFQLTKRQDVRQLASNYAA